jgi:hypothetical protein
MHDLRANYRLNPSAGYLRLSFREEPHSEIIVRCVETRYGGLVLACQLGLAGIAATAVCAYTPKLKF